MNPGGAEQGRERERRSRLRKRQAFQRASLADDGQYLPDFAGTRQIDALRLVSSRDWRRQVGSPKLLSCKDLRLSIIARWTAASSGTSRVAAGCDLREASWACTSRMIILPSPAPTRSISPARCNRSPPAKFKLIPTALLRVPTRFDLLPAAAAGWRWPRLPV